MNHCVCLVACLALWLPQMSALHNAHEWSSIEYDWPSSDAKQQAAADGSYAPSKIRLGTIKEFDGVIYVGTPRTGDGTPATLSAVVEKEGKPLLAPFPDWDRAKATDVVTFDIDRKGRLYAIEYSVKDGDVLIIYSTKSGQVLRKQPLPKNEGRVFALVVDDHGRSHTHITDDKSSTVFMLAANSGKQGALIVYTHQHKGDLIKAFSLPQAFDMGSDNSVIGMAISGNGDTAYVNSPSQLWNFQTAGPRQGTELRMYPVCGKAASSELQAIGYHPSSRQLVFGRDENLYKVSPLDAWSKTFEDQQVKLTTDNSLPQVSSIALDWKYDFLIASQSKEWKEGQINHRIAVLPTMELLHVEQNKIREAMDFSDL